MTVLVLTADLDPTADLVIVELNRRGIPVVRIDSLDCVWVNHPHTNRRAALKPLALAGAIRAGLAVPRTLITNEPEQARSFIRRLPRGLAAYKPLGSTMPPQTSDDRTVLWTNRVTADEITTAVSFTAHQFQEWIDKAYEVRLTMVGDELFAAEIHAGSETSRIDFRTDYDSLTYRVCDVPEGVADGVRSLMAVFGLRYAALDFLVDNDGVWFFVDLNPNGQFGFVPDLREPIATALANLLEGVPR